MKPWSKNGLAALLASSSLLVACSDDATTQKAPSFEVVRSAQQRNTNPVLSDAEKETLTQGEAAFAVDIYQAVRKQPTSIEQSLFLSPHSISVALAMTYAGARGDTAAEMKKALHFDLADDKVHAGFDYLDLALASRGQDAAGKDGKPFRLNIVNSVWGQKGYQFEAPFLDTLAVNYGAGLNGVDFIRETEKSRLAINGWVEEKTEKRIPNLIPEGALKDDARMVLVNAVYFNGAWLSKFEPTATQPAPFTKLDGTKVQVQMMSGEGFRPYLKGDGFEAVEMMYDGNELSMLVIAPTAGTFATFESTLTGGKVLDILAGLQSQQVQLGFPKLKLDAGPPLDLNEPLKLLGMQKAFDEEGADFTGIAKPQPDKLSIKKVLHKTFLEIDENGTEAAAATAVIAGVPTSVAPEPVTLTVDRPFLMAIVDRATKTIVFFGRIVEPKL